MADATTQADGTIVTPTALQNAAPAAATTAAESPSISQSILDLAGSVLSNNTGRGAAMGGLLGYLLNQYGAPGGVNLGVDMSKVSGITPRTTTLPRSRYVSYSDYGVENQAPAMTPQMARDFGLSGGLRTRLPVSSYSALPARQNLAPVSFTSAGAGTGVLQNPTVTPRSNNMISPLTGALMGSAIGYLMPSSSGTTTGTGGTSGAAGSKPSGSFNNAIGNLLGALAGQIGSSNPTLPSNPDAPNYDASGWKTDASGDIVYVNDQGKVIDPDTGLPTGDFNPYGGQDFGTDINKYDPPVDTTKDPFESDTSLIYDENGNYLGDDSYMTDYTSGNTVNTTPVDLNNDYFIEPDISYGQNNQTSSYFRNGGMATPMMADGGQVPHYYTYGTAIDPKQIMQNMAQGGQPQGGLHVPTVQGRHDYRNGSRVTGEGDGQSDDIPAMLADGEYVFDADTVAQLGNGSTKAGSDLLDKFREEIRSHKRSAPINKIPPPAKSPLAYLKAARSKKNG